MFTHCSFDATRNKLDFYRGKDCMERFCKDLKEHAAKTINYAKRKWYNWLIKKINLIKSKKFVIYSKKDLLMMMIIKSMIKSKSVVILLENIEELPIVFVT